MDQRIIVVTKVRDNEFAARRADGSLPTETDWREIEMALSQLEELRAKKNFQEELQ
jgi:hypothetical protein